MLRPIINLGHNHLLKIARPLQAFAPLRMFSATHDDNPVKPPKTRKPRALKAEKLETEAETTPATEAKPRKARATKKDKEQ